MKTISLDDTELRLLLLSVSALLEDIESMQEYGMPVDEAAPDLVALRRRLENVEVPF